MGWESAIQFLYKLPCHPYKEHNHCDKKLMLVPSVIDGSFSCIREKKKKEELLSITDA